LPMFGSTRLCVTGCGKMHPRCCRSVAWKRRNSAFRLPAGIILVHYTTSCNTQTSAPEDGQNNCPKHVELTGIINKLLLLYLVCCLYYLYQRLTVKQILKNSIYLNKALNSTMCTNVAHTAICILYPINYLVSKNEGLRLF